MGNYYRSGQYMKIQDLVFRNTLIGNTTFHDYSAKKVFNDWYRFSHGGGSPNARPTNASQPANSNELDAWNYTEATEAINCTVNSGILYRICHSAGRQGHTI